MKVLSIVLVDGGASRESGCAMPWALLVTHDGAPYYYDSATGVSTWDRPPGYVPQPPAVGIEEISVRTEGSAADSQNQQQQPQQQHQHRQQHQKQQQAPSEAPFNNPLVDKIDAALFKWIRCPRPPPSESRSQLLSWLAWVRGCLWYGILFTPFAFAMLQQVMLEQTALDAYAPRVVLAANAWRSGFVFLGAVVLYCLLAFTVLPQSFYEAGSPRLVSIVAVVILLVWVQQALCYRYILLREDFKVLRKEASTAKYRVCGRMQTSLNPRNWRNYIYLTVILAEFFQMLAVIFHSKVSASARARAYSCGICGCPCAPCPAPASACLCRLLAGAVAPRRNALRHGRPRQRQLPAARAARVPRRLAQRDRPRLHPLRCADLPLHDRRLHLLEARADPPRLHHHLRLLGGNMLRLRLGTAALHRKQPRS